MNKRSKKRMKIEKVFIEHLPYFTRANDGSIDRQRLADALEISTQALSYWFTRERVSRDKVKELIDLPGSTLTLEILWPLTE